MAIWNLDKRKDKARERIDRNQKEFVDIVKRLGDSLAQFKKAQKKFDRAKNKLKGLEDEMASAEAEMRSLKKDVAHFDAEKELLSVNIEQDKAIMNAIEKVKLKRKGRREITFFVTKPAKKIEQVEPI